MAKGFTTDGERGSLRNKVGSPSGKPIQNKDTSSHSRGTKDAGNAHNPGDGYADGNTKKQRPY